MAIFLHIDGVKGGVSAQGHEGAIAISSIQHSFQQSVSMPVGRPQDRVRSKPKFSQVILTKTMDSATNSLLNYAYSGKVIPQVECQVASTGDKLSVVAKYIFKNVIIARYETVVGAHGGPIETLAMHFTKMESTYLGRDAQNKMSSPQVTGYNLETADVM